MITPTWPPFAVGDAIRTVWRYSGSRRAGAATRKTAPSVDGFDPERIARYGARKKAALLADAGIVRNRLKIEAAVQNARSALAVRERHGSLDAYLWRFVDGRPIRNRWRRVDQVPARTAISDSMANDLRRAGFRFVGTTICYAFMQAVGMANDHLVSCFRHAAVTSLE